MTSTAASEVHHSPVETPPGPPGGPETPKLPVKLPPDHTKTRLYLERKGEIENFIKDPAAQTLLLVAGTGTGKTFAGSQIVLDALPQNGKLAVVESLRKVTEESAKTILEDRQRTHPDEKMGDVVGYRNRYHHENNDDQRLLFCPTRSLLNMIPHDKLLDKYDVIMVDEVHKETAENQHLLEELAEIQAKRAKTKHPLKIILTSATMDEVKLNRYFENASTITLEGNTVDVPPTFLEAKIDIARIPEAAAKKVNESIAEDEGNILVFLSGQRQIAETQKEILEKYKLDPAKYTVVPYLGSLPKEEQDVIFEKNKGKRLIVLATNAAQEGLTWPIKVVVDSCTYKHLEFDEVTGKSYLTEKPAPHDHLMQRKGRVGRTAPVDGEKPDKYYALTTEYDWREGREKHEAPDIVRTDLTTMVLNMLANDKNPYTHRYLNKPSERHIDIAFKRLERLGAVKGKRLTDKGRFMADLEVNVNNASLVAEGIRYGVTDDAVALAAMLEVYPQAFDWKNSLLNSFQGEDRSDLTPLIRMLQSYSKASNKTQWTEERGLRTDKMQDALDLYTTLQSQAQPLPLSAEDLTRIGTSGLDLALYHSFADMPVSGFKKHSLAVNGVGGVERVVVDSKSILCGQRTYAPFVSADVRAVGGGKSAEKRIASLNHELSTDAIDILNGKEKPQSPKDKDETKKNEPPPVETQPEPKKQESEEVPPSSPPAPPRKWYQKIGDWFKGFFQRLFG